MKRLEGEQLIIIEGGWQGHAKVQFQFFMDAIVHNIRRLVTINSPPLLAGA